MEVKAKKWGAVGLHCVHSSSLVFPVLCPSPYPYPQSFTLASRTVTQDTRTPGRVEQKCGTQAACSWRHFPARVASQGELTLTCDASDLAFSFLQTNNKNVHINIPKAPDWALLCEGLQSTLWSIRSITGKTPYGCMVNYKCFYITYIDVIPQESQSPRYVTISRQANAMPMHLIYNLPVSVQFEFSSLQLRDMIEQWSLSAKIWQCRDNLITEIKKQLTEKSSYLLKHFPLAHVGAKSKRHRHREAALSGD